MISVQIYIKKNTLVQTGSITAANVSPFLLLKNSSASYTTNQYTGHYIKIIKGLGLGSIAYISSNTATELTLQTPIQTDTSSQYEIYRADYQKLDLFSDEKISVTSSVANANDIGKIFTDYSQSFTIPASDKNNQILSHWYESCIDNGYDHRQRYDGYVEIDTQKFKDGNFQLEKANKKNGFIESYSVTFYGNLTQLKDRFKDDKLNVLDYSSLDHVYNSTNVINRINPSTTYSVNYPLIGSAKKYYYKYGIAADDINNTAGAIKWDELYPAIQLSKIFEFIQAKYNVVFTGSFFSLDQWTKLNLFLKNSDKLEFYTPKAKPNFTSVSGSFPEMNLTNDSITTSWTFRPDVPNNQKRIYIKLELQDTIADTIKRVYVYRNGVLYKVFSDLAGSYLIGSSSATGVFIDNISYSNNPTNDVYTFEFDSKDNTTANFNIYYFRVIGNTISSVVNATGSVTTAKVIPIKSFVPDITINDFMTGIVKAFNLMIIPKDVNTFEFIPLEMYYNSGKILDVSKYIYADEMDIERPKLYKSINFTYQKSPNILNNQFKGLFNTEYGDLIFTNSNSNESSNYEIKLPFENVMFEKTSGYNFQTATLIDKDLKPYTPKPMLIYNNGKLPTAFAAGDKIYVTTETTPVQIDNYVRFSNEYNSLPTDLTYSQLMSMNFSNELSPWYGVLAPKGLYFRHYKNYIDNLYNIKTRIVKVKALFPASLLASTVTNGVGIKLGIALNDRLIIRNKRYIINNMTTDLTTGEASLELLTDYRGVNAASSVGYKFAEYEDVQTDKQASNIDVNIYLNDYDYFGVKGAINFLSYTTSGTFEYKDILLPVTIPYNGGSTDRTDEIGIEYYKDGTLQVTETINFLQLG
jgi:hypothetical protein